MRLATIIAGTSAAMLAPAADAATIVQSVSPSGGRTVGGFDASLGTLNGVTLGIDLTSYRQWFVAAAPGSGSTALNWSINSYATVNAYAAARPGQSLTGGPLTVRTGGAGVATTAGGLFTIAATGAGLFNLDPTGFANVGPILFAVSDPGLNNVALNGTSMLASAAPASLFQTTGSCFPGAYGSDACSSGRFTLTYDYTPFAAVPEPATWTMMLIGFGAAGYALRRRRATRGTVQTA